MGIFEDLVDRVSTLEATNSLTSDSLRTIIANANALEQRVAKLEPIPTPTPPPIPTLTPPPQYTGTVVKVGIDVQTIDEAYNKLKALGSNVSGTILLEYGKEYPLQSTMNLRGFKSFELAAYGDRILYPRILTNGIKLINKDNNPSFDLFKMSNITVDNGGKPGLGIRWIGAGKGIIDRCTFDSCGLVIQGYNGENPGAWQITKSDIFGAYSGDDSVHMQGLYAQDLPGLTVENCTFDHNGWKYDNTSPGIATLYNHSLYLNGCSNVVIRGCGINNSSSMGIKLNSEKVGGVENVLIEDNYFKYNEILVGAGSNSNPGQDRIRNLVIQNNTSEQLGVTAPTKRDLAWGFSLKCVNGGLIKNNVLKNVRNTTNKFVTRIEGTTCQGVVVEGNREE